MPPNEGRLSIETAVIEIDEDYCGRNPDAFSSRFTMIAVSDTCNGTDPDDLSRIFEPFLPPRSKAGRPGSRRFAVSPRLTGTLRRILRWIAEPISRSTYQSEAKR